MTSDEADALQAWFDAKCKCGHARRWHGELVFQGPHPIAVTDGICRKDELDNECSCVVFRLVVASS